MDIFDDELLKFWETLNNNSVQYIMAGGFAVNLQGFSRATDDCDLWLKDTHENRKRHINHLLANKKAVNRPKDQIDVIELEKIKNFLEGDS